MEWTFERVVGPYSGEAHGLVWDGEAILFSLVTENRILRYHPGTKRVAELRKYTCGTRGLAFDAEGYLYGCQSSARRIARFNPDGSVCMLADRLDGRLHNQPYNLAVDRIGRIWFTDPEPALRMMEPPVDHASVLRLERHGSGAWMIKRMTYDTLFPTAIAFSKDQRSVFVADNPSDDSKPSELRTYALRPDDSLGPPAVMQSFPAGGGVNGMCVTSDGSLVLCLGAGRSSILAVLSSIGDVVSWHPFGPGEPINCAIGGKDMTTLYITSSDGCLYRVENFASESTCGARLRGA